MSKLFCDCKTDEEKSNFFLSGRGVETGVIAPAISNEVAMAFYRCSEQKKQLDIISKSCLYESEQWAKWSKEKSEQLADSQKREVLLRDALEYHQAQTRPIQKTIEALAATADLDGLILCHAEPVGYKHETADGLSCLNTLPPSGQIGWITTPLYRAWEPK